MKTKIKIKMLVDIIMAMVLISLMFGYAISPLYHEIMGIAVGIIFIIHLALNYKETKYLFKGLKNHNLNNAQKVKAILDVSLIVLMFISILSGLIVARVLFSTTYNTTLILFHDIVSYALLGVVLCHVASHVPYLKGIFSFAKKRTPKFVYNMAAIFAVVLLLGEMFYGSYKYALYKDFDAFALSSANQTETSQDNKNPSSDSEIVSEEESTNNDEYISNSDESDDDETIAQEDTSDNPTLDEYLGNLNCDGCGRHCSLLAPECGKGEQEASIATANYEAEYGQTN